MKLARTLAGVLPALAFLLVGRCCAQKPSKNESMTPPFTSVPTFSTANISRQGHFYVGGKWVGKPGQEVMRGAMYVETWVPRKIRFKYPILFIQSGGGDPGWFQIDQIQDSDGGRLTSGEKVLLTDNSYEGFHHFDTVRTICTIMMTSNRIFV